MCPIALSGRFESDTGLMTKERKPYVHLGPPEKYDMTVERLLAVFAGLTKEPVVVLVVMSKRRCEETLKKTDEATTIHGVQMRSNPFMPDDIAALRFSDGSWKFFAL